MAIKLVKMGVSGVVGAADILAEYIDERKAYTKSFQNVKDWFRTAAVVGGYAANSFGWIGDDYSEPTVLAGIPLLEKSIKGAVHAYVLKPMGLSKGRMGLKLKAPGTHGAPAGNIRWG